MRHLTLLSVLLFATALTGPAAAQGPAQAPPDAASARADDLTHRGNDLALKHEWAEAAALFRQAWALKQSYDISGNLGIASFALGKYADAAEYVTFALKHFPANGKREHQELLREKLAKARAEIGARTIEVSVAGAEVVVDGKSVGIAPMPDDIFVDLGTHTVEAKLVGYEKATRTFDVSKGSSDKVLLVLRASQTPPPAIPKGPNKAVIIGGASVTGAALITGIVLLVEYGAKRSDASSTSEAIRTAHASCVPGAANLDPRCTQLSDTGHLADTFHNAGVGVLIAASAVAAGTAAYGIWSASTPTKTGALRVVPTVSATTAGVLFSGSF